MPQATATLPPGPGSPAAWQLLRYTLSPLAFLEECSRRYGDPFTVRLAGYGPLVLLTAADAVKDVFRGEPYALHSGEGNEFLACGVSLGAGGAEEDGDAAGGGILDEFDGGGAAQGVVQDFTPVVHGRFPHEGEARARCR